MTPNTPTWNRSGNQVQLHAGPLTASLSLTAPWRGLEVIHLDRPVAGALLQIHFSAWQRALPAARKIDAYLRGSDLITTYDQPEADQLRCQIRWQAIADLAEQDRATYGIGLDVSAETKLLDSDPSARISTRLNQFMAYRVPLDSDRPPERLLVADTCYSADHDDLFLFRSDQCAYSYVQMVHPADTSQTRLELESATSSINLHTFIFNERLEKGVIRRARCQGHWVRADDDVNLARQLYESFITSRLPLTT